MDLQGVLNSRLGVALAFGLGRTIPRSVGMALVDLVATIISLRRNSALVRAIRLNQWVTSGGKMTADELDRAVLETLRATGRCIFDFYHYMNNPKEILKRVRFTDAFDQCIEAYQRSGKGLMFVAPHLSNFELAGRALALRGLRFLTLSFPRPHGGYRWQNEMRLAAGIELMPMSKTSLRLARERLRSGGLVLTGHDRPLPDSRYRPRFFGRPASMPVAHIHLALQTDTPVVVVTCLTNADGSYRIDVSPPIDMQPEADIYLQTVHNAEAVLAATEVFIRQDPRQWAMFYPVWPEAMKEVPSREGH